MRATTTLIADRDVQTDFTIQVSVAGTVPAQDESEMLAF
jgi:hypothetical protein